MRRDLIELHPIDKTIPLQFPQGIRQHRVGNPRQFLFQGAESDRIMDAQFIENLGLPLSLQHPQQGRDGTVAQISHNPLFHITQLFFIGHRMLHYGFSSVGTQ